MLRSAGHGCGSKLNVFLDLYQNYIIFYLFQLILKRGICSRKIILKMLANENNMLGCLHIFQCDKYHKRNKKIECHMLHMLQATK